MFCPTRKLQSLLRNLETKQAIVFRDGMIVIQDTLQKIQGATVKVELHHLIKFPSEISILTTDMQPGYNPDARKTADEKTEYVQFLYPAILSYGVKYIAVDLNCASISSLEKGVKFNTVTVVTNERVRLETSSIIGCVFGNATPCPDPTARYWSRSGWNTTHDYYNDNRAGNWITHE
jgi:hypothetical protein